MFSQNKAYLLQNIAKLTSFCVVHEANILKLKNNVHIKIKLINILRETRRSFLQQDITLMSEIFANRCIRKILYILREFIFVNQSN